MVIIYVVLNIDGDIVEAQAASHSSENIPHPSRIPVPPGRGHGRETGGIHGIIGATGSGGISTHAEASSGVVVVVTGAVMSHVSSHIVPDTRMSLLFLSAGSPSNTTGSADIYEWFSRHGVP